MSTIPSSEPPSFVAGETVQWTRTLTDYPATSWALTYYLIGPATYTVNATASGTDYSVTIPAATSANYTAGRYKVYARVTSGSVTHSIDTQYTDVVIGSNPSAAIATDARSYARKTLDLVEATISALAQKTVSTASVNGQNYTIADIDKLLKMRSIFRAEVNAEEDMAALNAGLGSPNKIKVRFGIVT